MSDNLCNARLTCERSKQTFEKRTERNRTIIFYLVIDPGNFPSQNVHVSTFAV